MKWMILPVLAVFGVAEAKPNDIRLHNHSPRMVILTYQANGQEYKLAAGPGSVVRNIEPKDAYVVTSIAHGKEHVAIKNCPALVYGASYRAIDVVVSWTESGITCHATSYPIRN